MELLAAVDLLGGTAVRLVQGDYGRSHDYGDPFALAERFVAAGAPWLHVVDLDAARSGAPMNRDLVVALAERAGVPVEVGGGVRSEADVAFLLERGVARVVLGTAALDDPGLCVALAERHPGRLALGLDYRRRDDGTLEAAARGWLETSGRTVAELLDAVAGSSLGAVVVTAIERDGTLRGPDLDGLRRVLGRTELPVVASGGVGSRADLEDLARLRAGPAGRALSGVIVGKALVDGRLSVEEGVAVCAASG
jgi:phosphoribosylformimino-5-aminoimidazole carboxamide ribotide isomerase